MRAYMLKNLAIIGCLPGVFRLQSIIELKKKLFEFTRSSTVGEIRCRIKEDCVMVLNLLEEMECET